MIHFQILGDFAHEGFHYQTMNRDMFLCGPRTAGKTHTQITMRIRSWFPNPSRSGPGSRLDSADPSEVANFVDAFKANDGTPFLIGYDKRNRGVQDHSLNAVVR